MYIYWYPIKNDKNKTFIYNAVIFNQLLSAVMPLLLIDASYADNVCIIFKKKSIFVPKQLYYVPFTLLNVPKFI